MGYKLRLTDLLIEPVQRLTKYHLLLETLVKLSRKAGLEKDAEILQKAHQTMKVVADQCNDMMDIGRLEGFEGKITSQGQLLYKGPLNVLDTFSTTSKKVCFINYFFFKLINFTKFSRKLLLILRCNCTKTFLKIKRFTKKKILLWI